MSQGDLDTISISEFKATCLAALERVRRTGRPLRVTRRGVPVADIMPPAPPMPQADWIGSMRQVATITGDLIDPVGLDADWEAVSG
jgi:prevent-host-death family protein